LWTNNRTSTKFCVKADKCAPEALKMIQNAYGTSAFSRSKVCRWYARFHEGREDMKHAKILHLRVYLQL